MKPACRPQNHAHHSNLLPKLLSLQIVRNRSSATHHSFNSQGTCYGDRAGAYTEGRSLALIQTEEGTSALAHDHEPVVDGAAQVLFSKSGVRCWSLISCTVLCPQKYSGSLVRDHRPGNHKVGVACCSRLDEAAGTREKLRQTLTAEHCDILLISAKHNHADGKDAEGYCWMPTLLLSKQQSKRCCRQQRVNCAQCALFFSC